MKTVLGSVSLAMLLLLAFSGVGVAQYDGEIVAWGNNNRGQCNVPDSAPFVAVAGGSYFSLGLKEDGSIVAWGHNAYGQCNVPDSAPFVATAGGLWHSLGLKEDGSIVGWGLNDYGQCNVPSPNSGFVAVAGGWRHSLGLKTDGSIVGWGLNDYGQCNVPSPNSGFVAVAAGWRHSLGLKTDGSIVAWGWNLYGQCDVPEPNEDFVAVAAGERHSLGLKEDGSIVAWGWNPYGQCDVPEPNIGFVAVAGGGGHSLGLKEDGSIVGWGSNGAGQCDVPSPNSGFVAVSAGQGHSLGLREMTLNVVEPDSSTVWTHFDTNLSVSWFGTFTENIAIILYESLAPVYILASSAPNTGSWIFDGPVPMDWTPGDQYRVYIHDEVGNNTWSEYFTITPSEGQEVITVTEPDASTIWTHFETDLPIQWEYPALSVISERRSTILSDSHILRLNDSGETVAVVLYDGGTPIDTLTMSISNTGSWVYEGPVPEGWEPGNEYRLYIVDDLDNYGWSEEFTIAQDVGIDMPDGIENFHLFPVTPNPSKGELTISYTIPHSARVSVGIYDLTGRLVYSAADGEHASGFHQMQVGGLPSGIYFCRLQSGNDAITERFAVIR